MMFISPQELPLLLLAIGQLGQLVQDLLRQLMS